MCIMAHMSAVQSSAPQLKQVDDCEVALIHPPAVFAARAALGVMPPVPDVAGLFALLADPTRLRCWPRWRPASSASATSPPPPGSTARPSRTNCGPARGEAGALAAGRPRHLLRPRRRPRARPDGDGYRARGRGRRRVGNAMTDHRSACTQVPAKRRSPSPLPGSIARSAPSRWRPDCGPRPGCVTPPSTSQPATRRSRSTPRCSIARGSSPASRPSATPFRPAPAATLRFRITGMDCADCAASVERVVGAMPGVDTARVNFGAATLTVVPGTGIALPADEIARTVARAGYQATAETGPRGERQTRSPGGATTACNGCCWPPRSGSPAVSSPSPVPWSARDRALCRSDRRRWLAVRPRRGAVGAGRTSRHERPDVRLRHRRGRPRGVGRGRGGGRPLRARRRAASANPGADARRDPRSDGALAGDGLPGRCGRFRDDGPVEALAVGDLVRVRPGERVPADGVVVEGVSAVDQSPITGESMPADKAPGDECFAGTVNGPGALLLRVSREAARLDPGPRDPSGRGGAGEQGPGAADGRSLRRGLYPGGHRGCGPAGSRWIAARRMTHGPGSTARSRCWSSPAPARW